MWIYGSGFPKSLNVSKAIANAIGSGGDASSPWSGWGTALKPAHEPVVVARKPLLVTVTENVLRHGTGGLNVDGCRVETSDSLNGVAYSAGGLRIVSPSLSPTGMNRVGAKAAGEFVQPMGRWPANVIHDGSSEVLAEFAKYGDRGAHAPVSGLEPSLAAKGDVAYEFRERVPGAFYGDAGTAARFFYCAKTSKRERANSKHPTIKPLSLIRYLVRLVTPRGGVSMDIFAGSGTHAEACILEGVQYIGVEKDATNLDDINARIERAKNPRNYLDAIHSNADDENDSETVDRSGQLGLAL